MASGIINFEYNGKLAGRIVWNSVSNGSTENTSKVKAEIQAARTDTYSTKGTWTGNLNIAGENREFSNSSTSVSDWVTMLSFEKTIQHNDNGTGSCYLSGKINGPTGTSLAGLSVEGNQTVTLDTIPRKSSVTCADGNIGSSTTINISRASSNFKHTLTYTFGILTGTIATKTSNTSIGWNIPASFYAQIPNNTSGKGTITCQTYDGDTLIGTSTCNFNAFVVNSNPTITATVLDTNSTTVALTGDSNKLIRYYSNAKITMSVVAKNSATIASQKVTCEDGKSSTTAISTLNNVESGIFNLSCTDSRGLSGNGKVEKTLVNYIKLALTDINLARPSTTSNEINANIQGNYFNANFGSVANVLTLKWRWRIENGTWSSYTIVTATKSGNTFSYSASLGTNYSYKNAYEFEILASDKLRTDTVNKTVTAGLPIIDIGKNDVVVNGDTSTNNLTVVGKCTISSTEKNTSDTYIPVLKNGEIQYTLRNISTSKTHTNYNSNQEYLATLSTLSFWNGAYNANNISNLTYCYQGTIQAKATSLYDNTSGTTGTITLSETSANFVLLEIFYTVNGWFKSVKVYSPNGKKVLLDGSWNTNAGIMQIESKGYTISEKSVTPSTAEYYANIQSNGITAFGSNGTTVKIVKINGYR